MVVAAAWLLMPGGAWAQGIPRDLADKLTPAQLTAYEAYRAARDPFERQFKIYWQRVEAKRDARKAKRLLGQEYDAEDYIAVQPPKYAGPELPPEIAKIVAEVKPPVPERPLATVADFLANAKEQYGFVPTPTHRARVQTQVCPGGTGRRPDQGPGGAHLRAGDRWSGHLRHAIGLQSDHQDGQADLVRSGLRAAAARQLDERAGQAWERFARRLLAMAATPGTPPERAEALKAKAAIVRRMLRAARSIPNEWSHHVRFAGTPPGLGIHALNLDADVGPWLQVLKLRGLKDDAANAGRESLAGAEIELMNLAGPRTGLEMMMPVAQNMPTSNFFSEGGYYRNTIVREKTAAELLKALNDRMEVNVKKPGAVEFAQIFDEVAGR